MRGWERLELENKAEEERVRLVTPYEIGLMKYAYCFGLSEEDIKEIAQSQGNNLRSKQNSERKRD